jgi:hypothetical protein
MKTLIAVCAMVVSFLAVAQTGKKEAREDIAAHRTIAAAHEKAAKCLESGKTEKECHAPLATECKAVAIGKYCGMRHRH